MIKAAYILNQQLRYFEERERKWFQLIRKNNKKGERYRSDLEIEIHWFKKKERNTKEKKTESERKKQEDRLKRDEDSKRSLKSKR